MTDPTPEQIEASISASVARLCDLYEQTTGDKPKSAGVFQVAKAAALQTPDTQGEGDQEACEECDDSGYIQRGGRQEICDCPCGQDVHREMDARANAAQGEVSQGDGLADELEAKIIEWFHGKKNADNNLAYFVANNQTAIMQALRSSTDQRSTSPKPRGSGD